MITLSRFSGPVLDQNPYNSCAGHALYSVVHAMTKQAGALRKIAIYQNYADARIMAGMFDQDPGVGALGDSLSLKAGQAKGLAEASLWANGSWNMYAMPTEAVYTNAATFKVGAYRRLPDWVSSGAFLENVRRELKAGKPLIAVMTDFPNVSGWHCVAIEGVGEYEYLIKNSFGTNYEGAGYLTFPGSINTKFSGVYAIDQLGPFDFTYSPERTKVAQLYACFLQRCPELAGLDFWAGKLREGWSVAQIARCLIDSPEGQSMFGAMTNAQYVESMYWNILGRAPDAPGFNYFVGLLDGGANRAEIFVSTMEYMDTYTGTDAGTKASADFLDNRTDVAMYYAVALQMDGSRLDLARGALVGITADQNTAEAAKANVAVALGRTA